MKALLFIIAAVIAMCSASSCSFHRQSTIKGKAIIITVDTTHVEHEGFFLIKTK